LIENNFSDGHANGFVTEPFHTAKIKANGKWGKENMPGKRGIAEREFCE
jgi:hypothetical protein